MGTVLLQLIGRLGRMSKRVKWSESLLKEIWEHKKKTRCSWVDLASWIKQQYGFIVSSDNISRWLRSKLRLSDEEIAESRAPIKRRSINEMTREELAARGVQITDKMLFEAKTQPAWCSDIRWKMELRRRENPERYQFCSDNRYEFYGNNKK
jgi:hypothetical protein